MFGKNLQVATATLIAFALSLLAHWQLAGDKSARLAIGRMAYAVEQPKSGSEPQSLRVVDATLRLIQNKYFDPERFDPGRMFLSALWRMQDEVPEFLVSYEPHSARVVLRVGSQEREFRVSDVQGPWDMSARLREVFGFVQLALAPAKTDLRALEYAACDGILNTLDPLSALLRPASYAAITPAVDSAVGLALSKHDQALTVVKAVPGSPAASAGFMPLDRVTRIDNEPTSSMSLGEVVNRLRGKDGSRVTLWTERDGPLGWKSSKAIQLMRRPIRLSSVSSMQLAGAIGYVRIESFQASTAQELDQALAQLTKESPLKGLVLDLRDNQGGLLSQATAIADRFLDGGVIVTTEGAGEGREQKLAQPLGGSGTAYPLAVLVNAISAAGSEIVAGALQRLDRAVIVGERSAGAGTIQLVFPHLDPDGAALKLTIARFLLSGDFPVSGVGIVPDIALERVSIDSSAISFFPSERTRSAQRGIATFAPASALTVRYERPLAVAAQANRDDSRPDSDFQITLARELVARMSVGDRAQALASVHAFVENIRETEARAISEHLRRLGIDWTAPEKLEQPGPRASDLRVEIATNRAHDTVFAGQTLTMTARLTNAGTRPIYRLRAVTRSENDYFNGRELLFGRVAPGKTVTASATFGSVPMDAVSRQDIVKLHFDAEGGEPPSDAELRPSVTGAPPVTGELELAPVPLASRVDRVRIAGSARARAGIVDVSLSLAKRRVAYLSNPRPTDTGKFDFAFEIALDAGVNVITIRARDRAGVAARRTVIVRRDGPAGEALSTPPTSFEVLPPKPRTRSYPHSVGSALAP